MDNLGRNNAEENEESRSESSNGRETEARSLTGEFHEEAQPKVEASALLQAPEKARFPSLQEIAKEAKKNFDMMKEIQWEEEELRNKDFLLPSKHSYVIEYPKSPGCSQSEGSAKSQFAKHIRRRSNSVLSRFIESSAKIAICGRCEMTIEKTELHDLVKLIYYESKLYARKILRKSLLCEICGCCPDAKWKLQCHILDHIYKREVYCLNCRRDMCTLCTEQTSYDEETDECCEGMTFIAERKRMSDTSNPSRCGNCGVIYDDVGALVHKMLRWLPKSEKSTCCVPVYVCRVCNFQHPTLSLMKRHILEELEAGKVLCERCQSG